MSPVKWFLPGIILVIGVLIGLGVLYANLSEDKQIVLAEIPIINESEIEQYIFEFVNKERQKNELEVLQWDDHLWKVSRAYSVEIANTNHFEHIDLKGQSPTQRALNMDYNCNRIDNGYQINGIGENLFKVEFTKYPNDITVSRSIVNGWVDSPEHHEQMLDATHDYTAVGVKQYENTIYVVQNFC